MKQNETLGTVLKNARTLMGLNLRQIEEAVGISNAYLSQLENDKIKKPSANVLYKLASMYRLPMHRLLFAAGIIDKMESFHAPASLFGNMVLTREEEDELMGYLSFIRFRDRKKKHWKVEQLEQIVSEMDTNKPPYSQEKPI